MTKIIACFDGLDPAYLEAVETPGWDAVATAGTEGECDCVVPSLTNVNNTSIVTGAPPTEHGITGNTYYESTTGEHVYMNEASFVRTQTRLETASKQGKQTAALVAKDKLRDIIGQGCEIAVSAEKPPAWLKDAVGPAPDIYSGNASAWLLDAAQYVLAEYEPDVIYVSTTDVVPHKHAPNEPEATDWVRALDGALAELHANADALAVTADHGMRQKSTCIDLAALLDREGIDGEVVRLIRDRHTYHHQNLGGAAYIYLEDDETDLMWLATVDGIDAVIPTDGLDEVNLPADRVGDALVLGSQKTVFGSVDRGIRESVNLRSHGSHHEQRVPYAATVNCDLTWNYEVFDALGITG